VTTNRFLPSRNGISSRNPFSAQEPRTAVNWGIPLASPQRSLTCTTAQRTGAKRCFDG
jgi:hypothetical protein